MKILVASKSILPSQQGSAFIVEKLARNFAPGEMVVVGGKTLFGGETERPGSVPKTYYLWTELNLAGRGARFFTVARLLLFPKLVLEMDRIFKEEQCDYVLGVFPDPFYLFAAYIVASRNDAGFSSYFHNTYLEQRKGIFKRLAKWIQPKIMSGSDQVFVMSDGMKRYYEEHYPAYRFRTLVHTFDAFPNLEPYDIEQPRDHWRLVLVGNFNHSNLEATIRLVDALKGDSRLSISIYTPVPRVLLKARGLDVAAIDHRGFVDDDMLPRELQKYDIFVLTHGFTGGYSEVEYRTIFPTRTIPLLVCGRPILAHSPTDSFLSEFLARHDCAELVQTPSHEAVKSGLERLIEDGQRRRQLVRNAATTAEMFLGSTVAAVLRDNISNSREQSGK